MASPDQTKTFRFSGKLIKNPTDLSTSPAYGGTILGAVSKARLHYERPKLRVTYEEFRETGEKIVGGPRVRLSCLMRQWDLSAILACFPAEGTTDADGKPLVSIPSSTLRAGSLGSAAAVKLLFAADDATNNPSFMIYSAIPEVVSDVAFSGIEESLLYVEWEGVRDSSNRIAQIGYLARMSL